MDLRERFGEYQDSLQSAMDGRQASIWTALPCTIDVVNLSAATVAATPTTQATISARDGTTSVVTLPQLLDVPIVFPRGGGYTMTFPVKPGDECLVIFASRNIDSWWQSSGVQAPLTARMHDLSDGFALVGPWSKPKVISNISASTAQFRSDDQSVYVELNQAGGITKVHAPVQIVLDAPTVTMTGVGVIQNSFGGGTALSVAGNESVSGNVSVGGRAVVVGDVQAGPITLETHIHHSGSGVTGPPVL